MFLWFSLLRYQCRMASSGVMDVPLVLITQVPGWNGFWSWMFLWFSFLRYQDRMASSGHGCSSGSHYSGTRIEWLLLVMDVPLVLITQVPGYNGFFWGHGCSSGSHYSGTRIEWLLLVMDVPLVLITQVPGWNGFWSWMFLWLSLLRYQGGMASGHGCSSGSHYSGTRVEWLLVMDVPLVLITQVPGWNGFFWSWMFLWFSLLRYQCRMASSGHGCSSGSHYSGTRIEWLLLGSWMFLWFSLLRYQDRMASSGVMDVPLVLITQVPGWNGFFWYSPDSTSYETGSTHECENGQKGRFI